MSKYDPLGTYLRRQRQSEVPMTFREIERITGTKLPASAKYRAWWSNNDFNNVMTRVWLEAGFKTEQVDLESGRLVFRRVVNEQAAKDRPAKGEHPLFGALKGLSRIAPGTDLTEPADPSWGSNN
jgi:hypothetical protein